MTDADVLIVGDGPVGQTLATLLAQRGWAVTVVDRWPTPYTTSRAVAFDSEAARVLSAAGITDYVANDTEPSGRYMWRNAEGTVLLDIQGSERGWCHWPDSTSMYQPGLESALTARGEQLPTLTVLRGLEVVDIDDDGEQVVVACVSRDGERRTLSARWVVGCDGARSFVRQQIGAEMHDLQFSRDWLICDVVLDEPRRFDPNNLQVCDPARPRTSASAGPGHRRWEFMRVEGESIEELDTPESAWRLLELFDVTPENATLLRHAVYSFQATWTNLWRSGRRLIAGDAAHVMPPFAGQGMCSGIRDAANLAWKLDLVLRDRAGDALLDTYGSERGRHVRHAVRMSVDLGKVICQLDPAAAADRDAVMIGARERGVGAGAPQAPVHPLVDGVLYRGSARSGGLSGRLSPQARVRQGDRVGLFDEVVGTGFVLLSTEDPAAPLDAADRAFLDDLGARLVRVVPADGETADGVVADVDDVYLPYLAEAGTATVLVRPDFYVYGQAGTAEECRAMVASLRQHVTAAALAS